MKKINKLLIFLFGIICGLSFSFADVISENSHSFSRCVKIENIDSVPGYKLVIRVQTAPGEDYFYEVSEGKCLPHHYKFGTATPILIKSTTNIEELNQKLNEDKEYVEDLLGLEGVGNFTPINVNGGYISNLSNKTYENNTYKLTQNNDLYELELIDTETDEVPAINTNGTTKIQLKKIAVNNNYLTKFFQSRFLTIFIETIILFLVCKLFFKKEKIKNGKIILTGILASTITLPILRFIWPFFFHNWTNFAITGEIFVTLVEIVIIKYILNIRRKNAIIASITCNLLSVIIGLLL